MRESFRGNALAIALLGTLLVFVHAPAAVAAPPAGSSVYPTPSKPFGKSYAQWSAAWWQWALARPVENHPFLEPFDCNASGNGQSGPVWFLAISSLEDPLTERSCTVPADTAILLALPNVECSSLEPTFPDGTGGQTAAQQRDCANFFVNHVVPSSLFCSIDDEPLANLGAYRFVSSQFTFTAPTPWIFGDTGGTGTAVSDGYYVMVKPPATGTHTLSCGGSFHFSVDEGDPFDADFGFGNLYHLTIQE